MSILRFFRLKNKISFLSAFSLISQIFDLISHCTWMKVYRKNNTISMIWSGWSMALKNLKQFENFPKKTNKSDTSKQKRQSSDQNLVVFVIEGSNLFVFVESFELIETVVELFSFSRVKNLWIKQKYWKKTIRNKNNYDHESARSFLDMVKFFFL